ncbi:UDP-glycosyltransferase 73E1-like [Asparagus officinalis]|uniref:UDP-glycosyltransferase 73E1-like n=1 Tax=Asparagus officinalis TaxID=4686 RepID=UPI00098E1A51|nr:UDP-glycosyltransferase 73E1-like [Asparagus officinalis]
MAIQVPRNISDTKPHFVLIPLMAQGHTIPMIDMAQLLASHGAVVTLITTPANAERIRDTIDKVKRSGLPVKFVSLRFPSTEVGLPEGLENIDMLPSRGQLKSFIDAICMLRDPVILHLRAHRPHPTCVISDNIHYWARDVAREFNIPRLVFHGCGCFPLLCVRRARTKEIEETIKDENEPFVVPGLPRPVMITKAQVGSFFRLTDEHAKGVREAELVSDGVIVNIYVSFGTLVRTTPAQLIEIGLGLEACDCPFIWVIKDREMCFEVEVWLSEFERRTRDRGLVIRGWAPQVMILSHPALGGFITHCGWNSTLESVSAGVPMITWPNYSDQFLNEKLIVEVLRIGVSLGVKSPTIWGVENRDVLVKKDDVEKAVRHLFAEGKEAKERRKRAKELAEKAQEAVEGGTSYSNLMHLIQHMEANN